MLKRRFFRDLPATLKTQPTQPENHRLTRVEHRALFGAELWGPARDQVPFQAQLARADYPKRGLKLRLLRITVS